MGILVDLFVILTTGTGVALTIKLFREPEIFEDPEFLKKYVASGYGLLFLTILFILKTTNVTSGFLLLNLAYSGILASWCMFSFVLVHLKMIELLIFGIILPFFSGINRLEPQRDYSIAEKHYANKELKEAIAILEKEMEQEEEFVGMKRLAEFYEEAKDVGNATGSWEKAILMAPSKDEAGRLTLVLCDFLSQNRKWKVARKLLEDFIQENPDVPSTQFCKKRLARWSSSN